MNTPRILAAGSAAMLLGLAGFGDAAIAQSAVQASPAAPAAALAATPASAQPIDVRRLGSRARALHDALAGTLRGGQQIALSAYAARGFEPMWLDADGAPSDAALILVDVLRRADEHALPVSKYRGAELAGRLSGRGEPARLEAELTAAFLDYARDLSSGLLEPSKIDSDLHLVPDRPDPAELLAGAAAAANMAAYLDGLAPQDPIYRRLVERYRAFRSIAGSEIWGPPIGAGGTLRRGDRGPRVADARARLTAMGDLDPNDYLGQTTGAADGARIATAEVTTDAAATGFDPARFDQPMEEALMRFQARHGLNQDGLIGPATLAQLNVSPRERAEQIAVNLERLRWLNRKLGERYVLVNQAGFEMQVVERGRPVFRSKVIVGQSNEHETPEFSEMMTHMVVNPTWYVPMSIARNEILPKLQEDPSYLARQGMRLTGTDQTAEEVDWATVTPGSFPGRVTQLPGEGNALGSVKFMFPNRFSVYLHDTPNKKLFDRDIRDFSHGCVRVERPHEFAEYLLTGQAADPGGYFDRVLAEGRERRIDLERPLPVHLTYRSAWIDESGVEQFRGDIYARDHAIARAMEAAGVRILG